MVTIIDYGAGNIKSVLNAMKYFKINAKITSSVEEIECAEKLILPGVGSFGFMMYNLRMKKLDRGIVNFIESGRPFLGICLGMQALFEGSEESPDVIGLSIFKGKVVRFSDGKIPQIGWNSVIKSNKDSFESGFFYFANSFYVVPVEQSIISSKSFYNEEFVSGVSWKNITAVQFHPEKSGSNGLNFLSRWLKC